MTNQNRPVYRNPPRSHAYNCPCPRCAPFSRKPDEMMGGCGILIITGIIAAVIAGIIALGKTIAHHPAQAGGIAGGIAAFALIVLGVITANRMALRPPKGRLKVEATVPSSGPPMAAMPPAPPRLPICQHLNAVMVLNLTEDEVLAWLCPHCDTRLPEDFGKQRRPCCGTPHGLWHLDNCPNYREWRDITGQWPS